MNVLRKTECIFWIVGTLVWIFDASKVYAATDMERFVLENENLCFNNIVSGNPEIISLHYKNKSNIFYWVNTGEMNILDKSFQGRIYVDRSSSLCFRNISRDYAGEYILEQEHPAGNKTIKINVYNGPNKVNIYPRQSQIEIGINSSFIMNCSAECFKACNFSWWKNNEYIVSTARTLLFKSVTKEDSGTYVCKVYNLGNDSALSESESVDLIVLYGTKVINTFPKNTSTTVIENADISFGCVFESSPPPNVTWIFQNNNSLILTDYNEYDSNISINNADCCDSGNYTCIGFNGIGQGVETHFSLNVACKPRFEDQKESYIEETDVAVGQDLTTSINIIAYPNPIVTTRSRINVTVEKFVGNNCLYRLQFAIFILRETDIKIHAINIENRLGKANVIWNIKLKSSTFQMQMIILACVATLSSAFTVVVCIAKGRDRVKKCLSASSRQRSGNDREDNFEMNVINETDSEEHDTSEDRESYLEVQLLEDVIEYENNCIAKRVTHQALFPIKELGSESQYDDLEPENTIQTLMDWPYEDVNKIAEASRHNNSLENTSNEEHGVAADRLKVVEYNNVFLPEQYENCGSNML